MPQQPQFTKQLHNPGDLDENIPSGIRIIEVPLKNVLKKEI